MPSFEYSLLTQFKRKKKITTEIKVSRILKNNILLDVVKMKKSMVIAKISFSDDSMTEDMAPILKFEKDTANNLLGVLKRLTIAVVNKKQIIRTLLAPSNNSAFFE